jgi:UPF0755 protein
MTPPMRKAFKVFLLTTLVGLAALGVLVWKTVRYPDQPSGFATGTVEFEIPKGAGAQQVSELLADKGLLERPAVFRLYAGQRGVASRFKAGHYRITAPTTPRQLLEVMIRGSADELVSVTLPPGKTLVDLAELLDKAGVTPKAEIIAKAVDPIFIRSLEIPGSSLEGYLFPDTYKLRPKAPAERTLVSFVRRHRQVYEELRAANASRVAALRKSIGFDDHKIIILASIVEKEAARPEERPRIAQLYLNRLSKPNFKPRRLQADPTIIYGCTVAPLSTGKMSPACRDWAGDIKYSHLYDKENPYNTYTHEGLPPGPIANPGRPALEAVMRPDGSPYLFFVAKNDGGSHHFSVTEAEHTAAVVKYQRGGRPMNK